MTPTSTKEAKKIALAGVFPMTAGMGMYLLLVASVITLAIGLALPTIELQELVFKKNTFSILAGIQTLREEGYWFLAIIIFTFSIVFPIVKLVVLSIGWLIPLTRQGRQTCVEYLEAAGKWSMLDVFVVALMIIITRTSGLIKAKPLPGIYWFAASVILAMLASTYLKDLHSKERAKT